MAYLEREEHVFSAHKGRETVGGRVLTGPERAQVDKLFVALSELPELSTSEVDHRIVTAVQGSFTAQAEAGPMVSVPQEGQVSHIPANATVVKSENNVLDSALTAEQTRSWLEGLQAA